MKVLKGIVYFIVIMIALALIAAIFIKKDYAVEREITINRPKAEVFDFVKYVKNQDQFSTWARKDPNMKKEYKGTDGTVGFISAWDSQNSKVGKGEQEIKKITEGERLDFELRFIKPFTATDHAYMTTESVDSSNTKVKWGFYGKMNYPMNLLLPIMNMDKMIGSDLEAGLVNLKTYMEAKK